MQIIKRRSASVEYDRHLDFDYGDGSGFSFPCDITGKPLFAEMSPEAIANYRYCLCHPELFQEFNNFVVIRQVIIEPAIGICVCGQQVTLEDQYLGACQCPNCGRWYNLFGQSLVDPVYWEDDEE